MPLLWCFQYSSAGVVQEYYYYDCIHNSLLVLLFSLFLASREDEDRARDLCVWLGGEEEEGRRADTYADGRQQAHRGQRARPGGAAALPGYARGREEPLPLCCSLRPPDCEARRRDANHYGAGTILKYCIVRCCSVLHCIQLHRVALHHSWRHRVVIEWPPERKAVRLVS